jgi:toxin HigB-1
VPLCCPAGFFIDHGLEVVRRMNGNKLMSAPISVNDPWRIGFRFVDGDAFDVELTDYH